jgi:hypothetical protein
MPNPPPLLLFLSISKKGKVMISQRYLAIVPGQTRGKNKLTNPMILLIGVIEINGQPFRDHLWIPWNKTIAQILPRPHQKRKTLIEFSAKPMEYLSSEGIKLGLQSIKRIKVLSTGVISKDFDYSPYINQENKKETS